VHGDRRVQVGYVQSSSGESGHELSQALYLSLHEIVQGSRDGGHGLAIYELDEEPTTE